MTEERLAGLRAAISIVSSLTGEWRNQASRMTMGELSDLIIEIESQAKTIESLRRDLADPPADVQEAVLRKLNLWPPPASWRVGS